MRKSLKILAATSAVAISLAVAPALYAGETQGSKMESGMMGQEGMMGMMSMMGQMGEMMESCAKMMQSHMDDHGGEHPNDQWREHAPVEPDHNG